MDRVLDIIIQASKVVALHFQANQKSLEITADATNDIYGQDTSLGITKGEPNHLMAQSPTPKDLVLLPHLWRGYLTIPRKQPR